MPISNAIVLHWKLCYYAITYDLSLVYIALSVRDTVQALVYPRICQVGAGGYLPIFIVIIFRRERGTESSEDLSWQFLWQIYV